MTGFSDLRPGWRLTKLGLEDVSWRPGFGSRCPATAPSAIKGAGWAWRQRRQSPGTAHGHCHGDPGLLLLLALALLVARDAAPRKGLWRNELGSNRIILALNTSGTFSGSYHTAVAATNKQILVSPLQGVQQHPSAKRHPTFSFTVQWQFSDSTTAFVGQCFVDHRGKETLETVWLLREEVLSHKDTWKATRVGTSIFTRIK
ncbi:avidin-like [Aphelocoma coerulescens]|uniref:avidin-like n=1 Tax=Aphelocoma coerulescens TaxID=39617 RepID=UPI003604C2F7